MYACGCGYMYTVNPHYSWIPYLQICLSLKFSPNPNVSILHFHSHSQAFSEQQKVSHQQPCSQLRLNLVTFCLLVSILITINKCPFDGLFNAKVFAFLCFLLAISLFKMALKCSAEVLSSVPKCKKAEICLIEKTL